MSRGRHFLTYALKESLWWCVDMWEFKSRNMEAAKEAVEIIPGKK